MEGVQPVSDGMGRDEPTGQSFDPPVVGFVSGALQTQQHRSVISNNSSNSSNALSQELFKLNSIVASSAIMAIIRAMVTPAAPLTDVEDTKLPGWMNEQTTKAKALDPMSILKDMFAFTAATYVMDGVAQGMKMVRGGKEDCGYKTKGEIAAGDLLVQICYPEKLHSSRVRGGKEDFGNKTMGGVAAGGLLSHMWFPGKPHSRVQGGKEDFGNKTMGGVAAFGLSQMWFPGKPHSRVRGGKEDFGNKTMGGVAAGGLLSHMWFPGKPHSRVILSTTGAVVGYLSYWTEQTTKKILLENQRKLEKGRLGLGWV
eukprot:gene28388-31523_t